MRSRVWCGTVGSVHELSIAQSIVDLVVAEAHATGATRVLSVTLRLGELAGVVEEQLAFCFPIVARGTAAEGAELVVVPVAGEAFCGACDRAFPLPHLLTPCPLCRGFGTEVLAGSDLVVASLEVE